LTPGASYSLIAFVGEGSVLTVVSNFNANIHGSFSVTYWKKTTGTSKGPGLADELDPISNIVGYAVFTGPTIVLQAMVVNPVNITYSVNRNLANTGVETNAIGSLIISGNRTSTHFRVSASGLTPRTTYHVGINGIAVVTATSDSRGRLTVTKLPLGSANFIAIQEVTIANDNADVVLIATQLGIPSGFVPGSQAAINLRSAAKFAVLAGAAVTSTGNTVVTGDLGVWAGSSISGFAGTVTGGPGVVHGTIHTADTAAQVAQGDLTTAFNEAAGRTLAPIDVANADLGGMTLVPGLYKSTGTLALTGTVVLDARGDANAVWVFQIASSLNTATGSAVTLAGGAKAKNVFWQVGTSATLATTTDFKGTIMADQSITLAHLATLNGRVLARIANITMDANAITLPAN
jgi:hypothetical protein